MNYQEQLIRAIFRPVSAKPAKTPTEIRSKTQALGSPEARLSGMTDGLDVYRNNYFENGIRALSITFTSVFKLMDESNFRALSKEFLNAYPKTEFDWADYGEAFPSFMMSHANLAQTPYLAEVAEMDWHIHQIARVQDLSFDADSFNLLQSVPPDEIAFKAAPGLSIKAFYFPVIELHHLAHDERLQQPGERRDVFMGNLNKLMHDAIKSDVPRSILLWRPDYKTEMHQLNELELQTYRLLIKGKSIAETFALFADDFTSDDSTNDDVNEYASRGFETWLGEQISQQRIYGLRRLD
uniref:HvfC/BufC N-terminal domain-containing protein n=1 Tax=Ningiella ruwaisensis TaxID=2364274 RepID=UPI00109F8637|nr:DNA-binding domain-containing protein [Ningiella ruwaisensis]